MTRPLATLALASAIGGLALGLIYEPGDGVLMTLFMFASGVPAIVAAHLLVSRRGGDGSARSRPDRRSVRALPARGR